LELGVSLVGGSVECAIEDGEAPVGGDNCEVGDQHDKGEHEVAGEEPMGRLPNIEIVSLVHIVEGKVGGVYPPPALD
jgi:hypothetical protein